MMDKPWKLVALLLGIFAAGVVTGGFVTMRFGRPSFPPRPRMESWRDPALKTLSERLNLTPDQLEKLKPLVKPYLDELARVRTDSLKETRAILDKLEHEVTTVLTPEQQKRFEDMTREQKERMSRFMKDRGNRGPHGGGDLPPGPPPDKP